MLRLDKKVAVVTGAGSGIGFAIARLFAKQGAQVAALDLNEGALKDILAKIKEEGGKAEGFACDVSDKAAVQKTVDAVTAKFGHLDILVNNAGIAHVGNAENTSEEDFDKLYRVNVKGVFLCTQAALPQMLKQGKGVIVNMASIASLIGLNDRLAYSMTKGAVLSMTRSVAVDYVKKGIRCNCICPARVHTPFVDGFLKKSYPGQEAEMFKKLSEYQPLGRMGQPEEVAFMALYLASDESSFITGQALPLDGGVLMS
jgi:NAD(P)-dependent dehydrogenase (short-subunit alcohol dehydrogenase family)